MMPKVPEIGAGPKEVLESSKVELNGARKKCAVLRSSPAD
jgi:hypothetical protein